MNLHDHLFTAVTWFVADKKDEATSFPSAGADSSSPETQLIYWRCVVVFFKTCAYWGRNTKLVFYTNVQKLPEIDGMSVASILESLSVEVRCIPITYRLPRDVANSWGNQFYILDIIKDLAKGEFSTVVVLDSDVVWMRSPESLQLAIEKAGVLTYRIGYAEDKVVNGLSDHNLAEILERYRGQGRKQTVTYCGGEIFAATHAECRRLAEQIDDLWTLTKQSQTKNLIIREEAQFLSILYAMNGFQIGAANSFIKRMWTALRYNNIDTSDLNLTLWHLPAEKSLVSCAYSKS